MSPSLGNVCTCDARQIVWLTSLVNMVCDRGIGLNTDMDQWFSPWGDESMKMEATETHVFLFMHTAWPKVRSCF